ncbi:MAG: porin family protein [Chlorobi bacterium]|nr:porin family protein [Chlorobiota bacterium]
MKNTIKTIVLALLMAMGTSAFSQGGGIWNFQWTIGVPTGATNDFLSAPSFRGFAIQGGGYVTDNLMIGGRAGWQVFYKDYGFVTRKSDNYAISGYQRRYINAVPLTINLNYFFGHGMVLPYIGFGVGPYYIETRDYMGIYYLRENKWHFGLAPEIGVMIPFGSNSNVGANLAAKYQYAFKTKDTSAQSWFEFNIGISYIF